MIELSQDTSTSGNNLTLTALTDRLAKSEIYQSIHFAVNETLVATSTMADAMPRILRTIAQSLNWQLGLYWVSDNDDPPKLHMAHIWQSPLLEISSFIELCNTSVFKAGDSLPGKIWTSATPVWFTNFGEMHFLRSEEAKRYGINAVISFPVFADLDVIGVIELFSKNAEEKPDAHLLEVLTNVGYRIGQFYKRKQLEAHLLDANARYRVLADAAYNAVIVANALGNIVEWNAAAESMFGWKKSEAIGHNLTLIIPEQHRTAHLSGIAKISEYDTTYGSRVIGKVNDLLGLHKDGSEFPVQISLSTWNLTGHRFFGAVVREGKESQDAGIGESK